MIQAGDKFNRWTAVRFVDKRWRDPRWLFKCECGTERIVLSNAVKFGRSKSCGCIRLLQFAFKTKIIQADDRFGYLTALRAIKGLDGSRRQTWLFKCDCGNDHVVRARDVIDSHTKSCGCRKGVAVKGGDIFKHLTAVRPIDETKPNLHWLFKCICGTDTILPCNRVIKNHTKSCGCEGRIKGACTKCGVAKTPSEFGTRSTDKRKERTCKDCKLKYLHKLRELNPALRKRASMYQQQRRAQPKGRVYAIFSSVKLGASRRNIPFEISKEAISEKLEQQDWKCCRTGIPFDLSAGEGRKPYGPSIDRIDNNIGYTIDNIQIVCSIYNLAKSDFVDDDVLALAYALVEHRQNSLINRLKLRVVK